ncbi:MAG: MBL fold metallo-hydrolase [Alcaligenaceae bacterium]|jgi:7,8-dihydropterin-6-yl-methyl-4-(beta-D-ribofuranosyl)aminobenzene 5'-phosphate synthase
MLNHTLNRRQFILGSSAMLAGAGLTQFSAFAQAATTVPVIDSLNIKVIVDSSYDSPKPGENKWVKIKRTPFISSKDFRKALHNEWGLALALESKMGQDQKNMLLDYAYTPTALIGNMEIMDVKPEQQHAMILSHGHFDHFGGLIAFLQANRAKLPADLTLYVGGEDNFCNRKTVIGAPGHFADWGVLDRRELDALKVKIVYCESATIIQGHAFTTGAIKRSSFETVLPNTQVEFSKKNGIGCDLPDLNAKADGKFVKDEHVHEHGTAFNLRDRGLVVISSCGHAGIVNTVQQAIEVSGVTKVHAILGGFHLFPAADAYLTSTVEALKKFNPDVVIPLHCSGPGFVTAMQSILNDRLVTSTTGTEFQFGS